MRLIGELIGGLIAQQLALHMFDATPAEGFIAYTLGWILAKQITAEVIADERSQNG
ncbi:hypothetical protein [Paenibacillus sp. ACRRY]|uniref:hypothetical protein n=1 Tax=Paenibacillus sp. ACRRY TaxID=2918208 RepID=UPI001EF56E6B|nr:hypothetical protein [Paenibacillus sp. ACRRY]MCG7383372.1 hypothetical protein [Paenibacillus sp. ACRRY]